MSDSAKLFSPGPGEHLTTSNHAEWFETMAAKLRAAGLFRIVSKSWLKPSSPAAGSDATLIAATQALQDEWERAFEKAAGIIYLQISSELCPLISGKTENSIEMWEALQAHFHAQRAGSRFNALDDLLSIQHAPEQPLSSVTAAATKAMNAFRAVKPASYTLDNLLDELLVMAQIRVLDREKYSVIVTNLLHQPTISQSDVNTAFSIEQIERDRSSHRSSHENALCTTSRASGSLTTAPNSSPGASGVLKCEFCSIQNHSIENCHRFRAAKASALQEVAERRQKGYNNRSKPRQGTELAGNASLRLSGAPEASADSPQALVR
jgi:hypothetical protein